MRCVAPDVVDPSGDLSVGVGARGREKLGGGEPGAVAWLGIGGVRRDGSGLELKVDVLVRNICGEYGSGSAVSGSFAASDDMKAA